MIGFKIYTVFSILVTICFLAQLSIYSCKAMSLAESESNSLDMNANSISRIIRAVKATQKKAVAAGPVLGVRGASSTNTLVIFVALCFLVQLSISPCNAISLAEPCQSNSLDMNENVISRKTRRARVTHTRTVAAGPVLGVRGGSSTTIHHHHYY
ncbi:unnamed protein product [Gordionus sp. m RMFG-2023]